MNIAELQCQRPGCSGRIGDGVCEECGRPPAGQSLLKTLALEATGAATGSATGPLTGTGRQGGSRSRRTTRATATTRSRLGGGLISLPPMPSTDPLKLVIDK